MTKERMREYRREYRAKNRERLIAKDRAYHAANRKRHSEYMKQYRESHAIRRVYTSMMMRCGHYKGLPQSRTDRYIGRGITVCNEWKEDYYKFEEWAISNGWRKGLQIDRINNNLGYSPDNCRFVSPKENTNNREKTTFITYKGQRVSVANLYSVLKPQVCYATFRSRIMLLDWDPDKAAQTEKIGVSRYDK